MKKSTRNILLGSGIAVAGIAAAAHYVTKYLMKIAMDRVRAMGIIWVLACWSGMTVVNGSGG